jgi:hypothetical protein
VGPVAEEFPLGCCGCGRKNRRSTYTYVYVCTRMYTVRVDWPGELLSHILVRILIKYSDISRLEHSCWIWPRPTTTFQQHTNRAAIIIHGPYGFLSLSFYPFSFFFFLRRVLDVHTGREYKRVICESQKREREQPGAEMSESVDVPPRSTHKTSQVELRCFFRSAITRTSPSSLELFQTARGVIFQAPSKKKKGFLCTVLY